MSRASNAIGIAYRCNICNEICLPSNAMQMLQVWDVWQEKDAGPVRDEVCVAAIAPTSMKLLRLTPQTTVS